jgi:hypothetical protein
VTPIDVAGTNLRRAGWGMPIAFGLGSVWVRSGLAELARIDPRTNRVTARVEVGRSADALDVLGGIAVGFDSVWLTFPERNEVWRIAPPG